MVVGMSTIALVIAGAVLVPVVVGIVVGAVMKPLEPWKNTLEVAAVGAGVIGALLAAVVLIGWIIFQPTECSNGTCHDTDTNAAVGVVFVGVLMPPIYVLVLPGAAIGKLLGRGFRGRAERKSPC